MPAVDIRPDLRAAQARAWQRVVSPGASWSGAERAAMARVALAALDDAEPLAPWVTPSSAGRSLPGAALLPEAVTDAVYRIARHASSLTEAWYESQLELGIDPAAYVEIVALVCLVAAVDGFYRAMGLERPPLPDTVEGAPHGRHPELGPATLNWVPVAVPADEVASVVQGLSAVPEDFDTVKVLAAAQYIPFDEMGDLAWQRGTLSRSDMEVVAARLSSGRQCFF